jgi:hypothetical protein
VVSCGNGASDREHSTEVLAQLATLAEATDADAVDAYRAAMRAAYWDDKDVPVALAIADAGASRFLSAADDADATLAFELRSAAKGLLYDVASFTWVGWDEPGVVISEVDAASGLDAARSNLSMAIDLEKGDLPLARAHWMLGAHLLTSGAHDEAVRSFEASRISAVTAGADIEAELAVAFGALTAIAASDEGGEAALAMSLERLRAMDDGEAFVAQVTTARAVLGC